MFAKACKFLASAGSAPPGPELITSGGPLNLTMSPAFFDDLLNKHLHKLFHYKL